MNAGLVLALLQGALPAPKASPTPAPLPVIQGMVRGPTATPIEQALVVVRPRAANAWTNSEPPITARTDAEGRFNIRLRQPSPVELHVDAAGFAPKTFPSVAPGRGLVVTLAKGRVLEGVVRDGASGAPLAAARVFAHSGRGWWQGSLPPDGFRETTTDAKGRFRLEGLSNAPVTLAASAPHYARTHRNGVTPGTSVELLLLRGTSISGSVIGPNREPVAGAQVQAETDQEVLTRESTDAEGRFTIPISNSGMHRVWAFRPNLGASQIEEAHVARDSEPRIELHIETASNVVGRLVGPSGPLPGSVSVVELDEQTSQALGNVLRTEAGPDGRFRLGGIPPGAHALGVRAEGFAPQRVEVTVAGKPDETVDLGDIELERGLTIRGRVVNVEGQGVAAARILGLFAGDSPSVPDTTADWDGSFVLAGLEPGTYWLNVAAAGHGGVKRQVAAGSQDVLVTLAPAGTLTGSVVDERGSAIEAFTVSPRATAPRSDIVISQAPVAVEASDGRFVLEDLAEGTYVVEADAAGRRPGTSDAVTVRSGHSVDVGRIRLEAGATVRGVVVDSGGLPIAAADVIAIGASRHRAPSRGSSGRDGSFELQAVPFGVVDICAQHPDYAAGKTTLETEPGAPTPSVRVVLSAGGRVEGHARRRDGSGVPSANVEVQASEIRPQSQWLRQHSPVSPTDGSFVVEHVPAGIALVRLSTSSTIRWEQVTVIEGQTTRVDFLFRDVLVTGRVTRKGEPLAQVRVRVGPAHVPVRPPGPFAAPETEPKRGLAMTSPDGAYELIAEQPGRASLAVEEPDFSVNYLHRMVEIPDADTFTLDVAIDGVPLSGLVVDEDTDAPVGGAAVAAYPKVQGKDGLVAVDAGPDGRFSMDVTPGDYRLVGQASGFASDGTDMTVGPAGLSEVRLSLTRGLQIKGTVLDSQGRPVGGVRVFAVAGDPWSPAASRSHAETLGNGSFTLEGLLDRPYGLFAGSELVGFAVRGQVSPGDPDVQLALERAGQLRVIAKDTNGVPVARALVRLESVDGTPVYGAPSAMTGADGTASLVAPQGSVVLRLQRDQAEASTSAELAAGETRTLEATLLPKSD